MTLARKLVAAIQAPLEEMDPRIPLSASVGIARYPDHGLDSDGLIGAADQAMYRAKGLDQPRVEVSDQGQVPRPRDIRPLD